MEYVELIGTQKCVDDLEGVSRRLADPSAILRKETKVIEAEEAGVFASLGGRFVKTGLLRNSLTLPNAPGAVRKVTGQTLEFGTSIGYARFQTTTIGPPTGNRGGMKRPPPVAVLKLTPLMRAQVPKDMMDYVVDRGGTADLATSLLAGMI